MMFGLDQHDNGHIHMDAAEYGRFKSGHIVSKVTEAADGEFVIGCFMYRRPFSKMTPALIQKLADNEGRLKVNFQVDLNELACSSNDRTLDGLNDIFEEFMDAVLMEDISYRPVGITDSGDVVIEADCDVSGLLDDMYPHYFIVSPETSGEKVWHLVAQEEPEFGGWGEDGPKVGSIVATEQTLKKIAIHAANYSLGKVPTV